ncbi:ACT domain-containing protein [Gymnodinialimonas sp.]
MAETVSDSAQMIAQMNPVQMPGRWAFRTVSAQELTALTDVQAMFREGEGISVLVPAAANEPAMVQITLQVFSDLEGVGLTAAVSTTLAEAGIPCNVIAATLHDHIFVPEDRCEEAILRLRKRAEEEPN